MTLLRQKRSSEFEAALESSAWRGQVRGHTEPLKADEISPRAPPGAPTCFTMGDLHTQIIMIVFITRARPAL